MQWRKERTIPVGTVSIADPSTPMSAVGRSGRDHRASKSPLLWVEPTCADHPADCPLQVLDKMAVAVDLAYDQIWRRSSKFEPKLNLMSS